MNQKTGKPKVLQMGTMRAADEKHISIACSLQGFGFVEFKEPGGREKVVPSATISHRQQKGRV